MTAEVGKPGRRMVDTRSVERPESPPMGPRPVWSSDDEFTIDGLKYWSVSFRGKVQRAGPDDMVVLKPRDEIESYQELVDTTMPRSIVELGIFGGGSIAFLAQVAQPERLVGIDIRSGCPALERFIDSHGLRGVVAPYYGVDQADSQRLAEIMEQEFGDSRVDLIIDDASHLLPQTRATFNCMFPRVRPGGVYVIEDWGWANNRFPDDDTRLHGVTPLSALVCELVLACARRPGILTEVTVDRYKVVVHRGERDLDPASFDISEQLDPVSRDMVDRLSQARSLTPEVSASGDSSSAGAPG